ncbi:fimbrial biogenesis outer membrane usher protein [Pseudomonas sp. FP2196]|uniref:fimbria/pilus outer membrane usher protein n=1 Tax=Pseudomonas sp. FP2196 TaxID=2954086 RepID=UPI00273564D3|nr:fimbria/pilus outer membrane usher protein [Pseudomonas sp. FP2196]WLH33117.1 fimbrial biogenesis outer membrane usher protein [Pseudomonas sp. FP2196]
MALADDEDAQLEGYNTTFLQGAAAGVDLALLLSANRVLPGNYRVDLYSNEVLVGRRDVDFLRNDRTGRVEACLTFELLNQLGIDLGKLQASGQYDPQVPKACYDLPLLIEQASVRYDPSRLRLSTSVPQSSMQKGLRGFVDPALWDEGVPAAFVNYQFNTYRNDSGNGVSVSNNLGLRNGINLFGWRYRNESNLSSGTGRPDTFKSNRNYLQHDVTAIKGQFSAGDIFSDPDVFDSVRYRGLKLASDEGMRADSERGYAPVIRGVAQSNATVEIRQNNYVLYTNSLPPGPFEISDIYPSGSNGDLEVTVIEADGTRRTTRQAFSSLPIMVREGQLKYSLSAGHYSSHYEDRNTPKMFSGTLTYGMNSNLTGLIGVQASEGFSAVALGIGKNTALGAVSVDVTHSSSRKGELTTQGDSVRALYAKTFTGTDTSFTLAAYRYSTEGYRTLTDHVQAQRAEADQRVSGSKTRTDLTINQSLGRDRTLGNLYLNASDQRYWDRGGSQSFSAGYANNWGDLTYNLGVTHTENLGYRGATNKDTQISLSLSFPLGRKPRSPRAFVSSSTQKSGSTTQAGINGYVPGTENTFYSVQGGNSNNGNSGSLNLNTRTAMADVNLGYSQGRGYKSQNMNVSGSVVAHGGGINLGQTVGETFALVEVPGVKGANVASYSGVTTGRNGYAVIPSVQPYRVNWISLDTRDLGADVDIENASQQRVPRRGAIVKASYAGKSGRRVQFELFDKQHIQLPFGASLEDASGKQLSISDPSGKALALVENDQGVLTIKWGEQQCQAPYALPVKDEARNYDTVRLQCAD